MMLNIAPMRYKSIFDDPPFDRDRSFYTYGGTGTGKTYYAYCVANYYNRIMWKKNQSGEISLTGFEKGYRVINVPELVMEYRNIPFDSKGLLVDSWTIEEVIFDDIGSEHHTDFSHEFILAILNKRWNRELWTGFTSNMSIGKLPYDDRIKSRIAGIVGDNVHNLSGKDKRLMSKDADMQQAIIDKDKS